MEKPLLSPAHKESSLFLCEVTCQYAAVDVTTAKVIAAEVMYVILGYYVCDVTCQYAAVDVATAKVIAAEVIVCFLKMLCK